jgi:glutaredoxin
MASISEKFRKIINTQSKYVWISFLVIGLCIIFYYVYTKYISKINNPSSDVTNFTGSDNSKTLSEGGVAHQDVQVMLFTVDWCPHCKNAKSPWDNFKNKFHGKVMGTSRINCIEYNMTEKKSGESGFESYMEAKSQGELYKVQGFPTLKLKIGSQVIDYDAKITESGLEEFLESVL